MLIEILTVGISEIVKLLIKKFFDDGKEEVQLSELKVDIKRLEERLENTTEKIDTDIEFEVISVLRQAPQLEISDEAIIINPQLRKSKEELELKEELSQALNKIVQRRKSELEAPVGEDTVITPIEIIEEEGLVIKKEENSEWQKGISDTLENIRRRRQKGL